MAWLTTKLASLSNSMDDFEADDNVNIPAVGITCPRLHHSTTTMWPDDDALDEYSSAVVDMIECRWDSSRGRELFVQGQYIDVTTRTDVAVGDMIRPADVTRLEVLVALETGVRVTSLKR